ncbi:hypothetical protein EC178900_5107 [Escherichia coli 178900]|nr:hypothetical protein EC178900_5107 [Escherichia coli 178900]KEM36846.1 hypothetical protein AB24_4868 [Escherichia coli 6-537-08_S1_C1]KEM45166.1 hypothetical protein AD46_4535 [Escherichia coli 6-175-07_S4_C3]
MRTLFINCDTGSRVTNTRLAEQQQASHCCSSMLFPQPA